MDAIVETSEHAKRKAEFKQWIERITTYLKDEWLDAEGNSEDQNNDGNVVFEFVWLSHSGMGNRCEFWWELPPNFTGADPAEIEYPEPGALNQFLSLTMADLSSGKVLMLADLSEVHEGHTEKRTELHKKYPNHIEIQVSAFDPVNDDQLDTMLFLPIFDDHRAATFAAMSDSDLVPFSMNPLDRISKAVGFDWRNPYGVVTDFSNNHYEIRKMFDYIAEMIDNPTSCDELDFDVSFDFNGDGFSGTLSHRDGSVSQDFYAVSDETRNAIPASEFIERLKKSLDEYDWFYTFNDTAGTPYEASGPNGSLVMNVRYVAINQDFDYSGKINTQRIHAFPFKDKLEATHWRMMQSGAVDSVLFSRGQRLEGMHTFDFHKTREL